MLRIDPHGDEAGEYGIPPDNPYAGDGSCEDEICDEIWSYGLRNPWRFSFDRASGDVMIADVGQGAWEEVDHGPAPELARGLNFGWDSCEGRHGYESPDAECDGPPYTLPVLEYPHEGGACSITGGYVVRDASLGDLAGRYVYGDYCVGEVRSFDPADPFGTDRGEGLDPGFGLTSFGEDACGRIYAAYHGGTVYRLTGDSPADCPAPPPPPGSPGPGDPSARPSADTTPPGLGLRGKRRRRAGSPIAVKVTADEAASVELEADPRRAARRRARLRDKSVELQAGLTERVRWKLGGREKQRLRRAVRGGRRAKVLVSAVATDGSGNASAPDSLRIKLGR